ncbi:uncharacterized protein LOC131598277 [Vicia villosa]|uniref:uncharacterized protein LOC131598277 n=1 Tax=Vicia villosa TaxID=3911 RepID=UPI00273A9C32|nr:uncharacterized protein LOC131598277 [Vicia villosa]
MLAKAIATEAGTNFINISTSSIMSKADSLLGRREGADDSNYEAKIVFFVRWDGLRTKENNRVLVLVLTNRLWDLDDAVLRSSQEDLYSNLWSFFNIIYKLLINFPDASNRENIFKMILASEHLSIDVNLKELANKTSGYSGSDL